MVRDGEGSCRRTAFGQEEILLPVGEIITFSVLIGLIQDGAKQLNLVFFVEKGIRTEALSLSDGVDVLYDRGAFEEEWRWCILGVGGQAGSARSGPGGRK